MLRRLVCRIRQHNLVFEVDWARMMARYRCTRCAETSKDLPLETAELRD